MKEGDIGNITLVGDDGFGEFLLNGACVSFSLSAELQVLCVNSLAHVL